MKHSLKEFLIDDPIEERKLVSSLINDPFYEFRDTMFKKNDWVEKVYLNDFFIQKDNFTKIINLMDSWNEDFFYLTTARLKDYTQFFIIPKSVDIDKLREDIDSHSEIYNLWYFFSSTGNWAAIAEYDGDSLFVGYKQTKKYKE